MSFVEGNVYVIHTALIRQPRGGGPTSKDKICLCLCASPELFFWFNTDPAHHGVGQLPVRAQEAPGITASCHLDLSRVTTFPSHELASASHRGEIDKEFACKVAAVLRAGVKTLPPKHAKMALEAMEKICPPPRDQAQDPQPAA